MSANTMITVEDRLGNRQVMILDDPTAAPEVARDIAHQLVTDLAETFNVHPDDAAGIAVTLLVQRYHDEQAYQREAARRGVLAL